MHMKREDRVESIKRILLESRNVRPLAMTAQMLVDSGLNINEVQIALDRAKACGEVGK